VESRGSSDTQGASPGCKGTTSGGSSDAQVADSGCEGAAPGGSFGTQGARSRVRGCRLRVQFRRSGCKSRVRGCSSRGSFGTQGAGSGGEGATSGCSFGSEVIPGGEGACSGGNTGPQGADSGCKASSAHSIPANINQWSLLEAGPVLPWPPRLGYSSALRLRSGQAQRERQEAAASRLAQTQGVRTWRPRKSTPGLGRGARYNLGVIMRPPFVAVDLDSKPDNGESVRAGLASPTRTGGSAPGTRAAGAPVSISAARTFRRISSS